MVILLSVGAAFSAVTGSVSATGSACAAGVSSAVGTGTVAVSTGSSLVSAALVSGFGSCAWNNGRKCRQY